MASDAVLVNGVRFFLSTNGGASYTELVDMKSIGVPGSPDSPEVDVTPLADNSDFRQFRLGLANAGECEAKQFYKALRFQTLDAQYRKKNFWKIQYPDGSTPSSGSTDVFEGWLKMLGKSALDDPDNPITLDFKIKLTGKPVFTPGT